MGRQQDLERLALGRSAFQDVDTEGEASDQGFDHAAGSAGNGQLDGDSYKQQYDNKGRPINPATEERNQSMRNAQNAVLALVGVVESKEASDHQLEKQCLSKQEAREKVLKAEQARGNGLGLITSLFHVATTWWPETLTSRIQAGVYAGSMSFTDIVLRDLTAAQYCGSRGLFDTFFAGAPVTIFYGILKLSLRWTTVQGFGRLQKWLNKRLQASTFDRVNRALLVTCVLSIGAIDAALLPMQYYATAQKLGLAPSRPLLLEWKDVLPWNTYSMHTFIWKSAIDLPFLGMLCSPALLVWLQNVLMPSQESVVIVNKFSMLEYLLRNEPYSNISRPSVKQRPFGRLLCHGNLLRVRVLKWFGWNLKHIDKRPRAAKEYENNYIPRPASASNHDPEQSSISNGDDELQHVHRSTSLSHLPAQYLADLMDELYTRLLMMPLDSLVLRIIALSFLASTLPKTPQAISAAPRVYAPFGGGPLGLFRAHGFSTGTWHEVGSYMSKLGLSLALHCSVEVGVFFTVYKLTRWQGIRNFDWDCSRTSNTGRIERGVDGSAELNL